LPHRRQITKDATFDAELRRAIPNPSEMQEIWEGAVQFFTWLAHTGHQFTDDETNYDVWSKTIPLKTPGKQVTFYYSFTPRTVRLQSAIAHTIEI
jgi:hypothetical protein